MSKITTAYSPMGLLDMLISALRNSDASTDELEADDSPLSLDPDGDAAPATPATLLRVVDWRHKAAKAVYRETGKNKRDMFPRANLRLRTVYVALHQMGVEVPPGWSGYWKTTAHYVMRKDGVAVWNHDHNVQLLSTNRINRAPYHAIAIEFAGNLERQELHEDWWQPEANGRGYLTLEQERGGVELIRKIHAELLRQDILLAGIVPHCVYGRDKRGKPNRQGCPGSAIWSRVGEVAAAELELPVPGPQYRMGGVSIPDGWRNPELRGHLLTIQEPR